MKQYDSHVHIGEYLANKNIIENSIYKNKYKLYGSIKEELIFYQDEYISKLDDFFAIPLFFKESSINDCNQYVVDYCEKNHKGVPVLLLNHNDSFTDNYNFALFKEHFLLHDYLNWRSRSNYYDFLNENEGFLLIHCKDKIRIEYIQTLLNNYPSMKIIIAHLGRDAFENPDFIKNVVQAFQNNERVFFDISTIHNINNIKSCIQIIGVSRLLYGSDYPFEYSNVNEVISFKEELLNSIHYEKNIFEKNFEEVKRKVYVKK